MGAQRVHAANLRRLDDLDETAQPRSGETDLLAVRSRDRATGTACDVSTAIVMNRLPSPSAVVAAMLPCTPGGRTAWLAAFPQSAGSKVIPGGRVCGPSSRGSMPVGPTLVTLNCDPKLDLMFATWAMSACEKSCSADCGVAHAASSPALAMMSNALGFDIAANVPAGPAQLRNADTVFTSNCAAKSCPSEGFGESGSLTTVTNAT